MKKITNFDKKMKILFLFLIFFLIIKNAHAISVVSDYLGNDTMELISGDSKIYSIRLQNPTDYETRIKVDYDVAFIRVINYKEIYILAPRESGHRILFNVTAPKEAGTYRVGYTVSELESGTGAGLAIRLKINKNFNLKVIENPNASKPIKKDANFRLNQKYLLYVIIMLALLFLLANLKKHKKDFGHMQLKHMQKHKNLRFKNRKIIKSRKARGKS